MIKSFAVNHPWVSMTLCLGVGVVAGVTMKTSTLIRMALLYSTREKRSKE